MKKYIIQYSLMLTLAMSAGCNDLLDTDIVSDIVNKDYWKTEDDARAYLVGIYAQLRDAVNTTYYFEDRGDAFVKGMEGGPSNAWTQNLNVSTAPGWLNFYKVINHCNQLLKHTPGIPFADESDRDRILAEGYFIRAYMYYWLIRAWGDVPLELEPTENADHPQLARASQPEVMAQIEADVNRAIELFPENGFINKSRASKPAAWALKADALLWKHKVLGGTDADLQDVITAADNAGTGLSLESTYWHIYATDRRNGKEVIFSIHFQRDEKTGQYASQLKPRDIFVQDAVNRNSIAFARSGARSQYAPSPKLEDLYLVNSADVRLKEAIIKAVAADGSIIGVFDNKMRGSNAAGNRYYDSDIIVYRLSEMYLFKAEALAALNRPAEAITELNRVRNRAKTGDYTGAADKLSVEREILNERFRELYLELKRWPDLVRFHYAGIINIYDEVPNLNDKRNLPLFFPISNTEMDRNTKLEQTAGYTE
ncbi:RagB/SusD family nutrient uptake outer membrane protein [Chitinophaga japonensis]|uniref:Putative outer membrane starch-binding protein n=1 Tax=Chitinophaga japonensis TaxID=104662 RepID=A0A562T5P7_CHIJA|nr:RagB/SusD family nutrient uptake outer membrane protein [Chitinophaga japonensis]TWI88588.1 putative outer membrane starch-binding protein [Chitinophaga japonensis]